MTFVLDVTRLMSRVGHRFPTGIDRVEFAYLNQLTKQDAPVYLLAKIGSQTACVGPENSRKFAEFLRNPNTDQRPLLRDAIRFKISYPQRQVRSVMRRHASITGSALKVANWISRNAPNARYYNVGHSNLSSENLGALKNSKIAEINIFIHDMIPIDHPEYTSKNLPQKFTDRMDNVAKFASGIICNSNFTYERAKAILGEKKYLIAPLGIESTFLKTKNNSSRTKEDFLIVGTVEGRKNHQMLFDIWTEFGEGSKKKLHVIGQPGWRAEKELEFLKNSPLMNHTVFHHADLNDQELTTRLKTARAILFPSFVEGYGLPAAEAAALGCPVIASDIPALHEVMGKNAIYLDPHDKNVWANAIIQASQSEAEQFDTSWKPPTWQDHFAIVFGD